MAQPLKPEHANRETAVAGAPGFTVKRWLAGYAYAVSGNAGNPTPRYTFTLHLDGRPVDQDPRERVLRNAAKAPGARKDYSR
jgi:hypothetical protein